MLTRVNMLTVHRSNSLAMSTRVPKVDKSRWENVLWSSTYIPLLTCYLLELLGQAYLKFWIIPKKIQRPIHKEMYDNIERGMETLVPPC